MKTLFVALLAIPAGLLLGYQGGRMLGSDEPAARATTPIPSSASPSPRSAPSDSAENSRHDLGHLTALIKDLGGDEGLERQLERMESSELRELALGDWPDVGSDPDQLRSRGLLQNLIASELFRREGIAALEWADQLDGQTRSTMLKRMVTDAAASDPLMAKPWIDKVMNDYGRVSNYATAAENGAKSRGAEELAAVYDLFQGLGGPSWDARNGFAENFDFRKFVNLTLGKHFISGSITTWAAHDKDAALASLVGHSREQGEKSVRYTGALFHGAAAVMGDDAAARWITGKLDDFPAELRDQAVKSLRGNAMLSRSEVEAFMTHLPTQNERMLYASEVISPWGSPLANEAALAAFKTPAAQTELMLEIASRYRAAITAQNPSSNDALSFFENTLDRLDLPDSSRQQVMDSLHQPPGPR